MCVYCYLLLFIVFILCSESLHFESIILFTYPIKHFHPLNPTQNHLVNSTLSVFNLSTQPSIMPDYKHPKTKKSESWKRTPNSRKCLVFKPFSVFTSVLSSSILRTQRGGYVGTYQLVELFLSHSLVGKG